VNLRFGGIFEIIFSEQATLNSDIRKVPGSSMEESALEVNASIGGHQNFWGEHDYEGGGYVQKHA
jgi:hypothetical protein